MASRWHPKRCRVCGLAGTPEKPTSAQGYCLEHGLARMNENNLQLIAGEGPFYDRWARKYYLAALARVKDQLTTTG